MLEDKLDKKPSVLCIDDNEDVRKYISIILENEGYSVFQADDGIKGIEAYKSLNPDIVITDLKMPNMDGYEILKRIKEDSQNTPVIVITGNGNKEDAIKAMNNKASAFIEKPFSTEILYPIVNEAYEKLRLIRQNSIYQKIIEEQNKELIKKDEVFKKQKEKFEKLSNTHLKLENLTSGLEYEAMHDDLTDLVKRKSFLQDLQQTIDKNTGEYLDAVLFIDMDRFKEVNDVLGHEYGDIVLKNVAKRLNHISRQDDVVCRYA